VALYPDLIARELGLCAERRRWLHRGTLRALEQADAGVAVRSPISVAPAR
jgi:hypothetical protein